MTISVIFAGVGIAFWNNVLNLKFITMAMIIISIIGFAIGEFIVTKVIERKKIKLENKFDISNKNYKIYIWKYVLEVIFIIITIILLFLEVRRIAIIAGYSGGSFSNMINKYRELSILNTTELIEQNLGLNVIVAQMKKVCEVLAFINIYLLCINILQKKINKIDNFLYGLIVILTSVLSILIGERMQLMIYIVSFVFMFSVLSLQNLNFKEFFKRYFKMFFLLIIVTAILFTLMMSLLGRGMNTNIISYVSFYLGSQVPCLDRYLETEHTPASYFGEETLRGISTVGYKLHIFDKIQPITTEWQHFQLKNGLWYRSNVYTSAKRFYHDFGWPGIVICQIIFSTVFSIIYKFMLKNENPILFIFYSSYFYMIIDQIRDDLFYSNFIHINSIFRLVVLIFLYTFLTININEFKEKVCEKWKKKGLINQ